MRRYASKGKRDLIEKPCVELLRKAGWQVVLVSTVNGPDAIAAKGGQNVCFEFKGKKGRKDQPQQQAWRDAWPGAIATVYSVEDLQQWLQIANSE